MSNANGRAPAALPPYMEVARPVAIARGHAQKMKNKFKIIITLAQLESLGLDEGGEFGIGPDDMID